MPKIEEAMSGYFCVTPNTSKAIKAYGKLKDSDGKMIFTSERVLTKISTNMKNALKYYDKNKDKLIAKPADITSSDWKELKAFTKKLTKDCKTTQEKVDVIIKYVESCKFVDKEHEIYVAKNGCGYYLVDWLSWLKNKEYEHNSTLGTYLILMLKSVGIPCTTSSIYAVSNKVGCGGKILQVTTYYKVDDTWYFLDPANLIGCPISHMEIESYLALLFSYNLYDLYNLKDTFAYNDEIAFGSNLDDLNYKYTIKSK